MLDGSLLLLGLSGPELTPDEAALFRKLQPAGYLLAGRNIVSAAQTRRLTDDLRDLSIDTPILASSLHAQPSATLRFAAAVAAYADALRGGTHLGDWNWNDIARSARSASGGDPAGERAEFAALVDAARSLTDANAAPAIAGND